MWSNISGLNIADQKVAVFSNQLSVELDQFLKFEGGNLPIPTWKVTSQSLKS